MTDRKYEIQVEELNEQPVLHQRFECPAAELTARFGEVLPAVFQQAMASGSPPAGPPYARYHGMGENIDVEAGIPTAGPAQASGEIRAGTLPGGPAAVTMHIGSFDGLGAAHEALAKWAADNGRQPSGGSWEMYLSDPEQEPDSSTWQTRIVLPLER